MEGNLSDASQLNRQVEHGVKKMSTQELLTYWRIIKKRWWLIGLLVGSTLGAILLISYLAKPTYRATTSFQVVSPLPADVSIFREYRTSSTTEELLRTKNSFLVVLKSEFVLGEVIEKLGLSMDSDELLEQVLIEPDKESEFTHVRVTATRPELAADIANTLLDQALQHFGGLSAGSITANKEFIQQQLRENKDDLDAARAALIQFQIEHKVGSLNGLLVAQESLITDLKASHDRALAEGKQDEATTYEDLIAARQRELQQIILLNSEYDALQDGARRIEAVYSDLLDRETEAKLKENEILSAKFIEVIPAPEPKRALPRLNARYFLVGGAISLVAGVIIVFILEALERSSALAGGDGHTLPSGSALYVQERSRRTDSLTLVR